jgi:hypothetical protein
MGSAHTLGGYFFLHHPLHQSVTSHPNPGDRIGQEQTGMPEENKSSFYLKYLTSFPPKEKTPFLIFPLTTIFARKGRYSSTFFDF